MSTAGASSSPAGTLTTRSAAVAGLAACLSVATAGWLIPASVHIVQWPDSGPVRVALMSPAWQLPLWWAGAAVIALTLWWRASSMLAALAPLLLLATWAVPYLPWLPDRLPLLLVLAGPLRWLVAAFAAAMVVRRPLEARAMQLASHLGRRSVLAISLALYVGLGLYSAQQVGVGGDEPHYLIITESLLRDHDLKIENNHRQRDYRSFFNGDLRPDYFTRGKDGEIYSVHAPGLPALAAPAYAIGGRNGVVVFIAILAALTALAIFDLAEGIAGRAPAWLAWLACCVSVPFLPYAWLIFPEMPGALLVAWAALWLWQPKDASARVWLIRGVALAAMPWLHTKFIVFLAIFSLGFAIRLRRQLVNLVALGVPIAASTALWFYSFYAIYGSLNPESQYGDYSKIYVLTKYIPHGLIGIFFDQKFGLLFYSPVYLLAIGGAWLLLKRADARLLALTALVAVGAFVGSTARLYMFWGGSSAPARFLVPVLPCLAPLIAMAVQHARRPAARALIALWLGITVLVAAAGVLVPGDLMLFSDPHGRARLLEWLQAGSPLPLVVPTFTEPTWEREITPLAGWFVAAAVALGALAILARVRRAGAWMDIAIVSGVFLVAGAAVSAQPDESVRAATARRGALETLAQFDGERFRTLSYATMSRLTPEQLLALARMDVELAPPAPNSTLITAPLVVPPGNYEVVVGLGEGDPQAGQITVSDSPRAVFARAAGPFVREARLDVSVPMATRRLVVSASDAALAQRVRSVALIPLSVVPPSRREPRPVRAIEGLDPAAGRYLGYTDEHAYPEGGVFWTRGTAETTVVVTTGGAQTMRLILSTGPRHGRVTVTLNGEARTVEMQAGVESELRMPLSSTTRLAVLAVQSEVMFRPAEEDPRSDDMRGLGCQVRIILE